MPDETPAASGALPPAGDAGASARPGLRANLQALTSFWSRSPAAAGPAQPNAGFVNPLRARNEPTSLFGEILDWMLAPLLLLWPMSLTITYLVAQNIANSPHDRQLGAHVQLLSEHLSETQGTARLDLPLPARELLRADGSDNIYFMVLGLRGELVEGDRDVPLPPEDQTPATGTLQFRDDTLRGIDVRIAYTWTALSRRAGAQPVLIQVAETLEKRTQLANEIIKGVIVPQFVVLPVAVILLWFGLSRGLAPLTDLQARIRARRPDDLSPIEPRAAPEEMVPLIESFNDLLARLEQNLATHKRFIADAAHQMKTPLAGLRTQAELALRETEPDQVRRSLRQIGASSERAARLVNQLLSLARAEHQSTDLAAFEPVDLADLARDQIREWLPAALARRIDLGYEGPSHPVLVIGVGTLLRELLRNLIDNALRYTSAAGSQAGTVTVRVREQKRAVYLEVEDNGPGIPESERALVFERFYRVLGTHVDGSGLGLSIVREIAQQHDALLRVGPNPQAAAPEAPGTLISVEFGHTVGAPPTVELN
jgi:two-component system sensor histidine kinase TctE